MTQTDAPARPAEFDVRLMNYFPHLRRLAHKLTNSASEREDLLQDSIAYILTNWGKFRPDGGFYNWITFMMRNVAQEKRRKERRRSKHMTTTNDERAMAAVAVPPNQLDTIELREALECIPEGRDGEIVMRRAMGDTLVEIGADLGVGRERARQLEERGLAVLRKRVRRAA
ncbi:sigma-70 family RNA polymerase sigma factor [Rhizobium phaseoli]|uniref:sigma-70 family RNA polymerase sigma factor n=1 Tax=Rhizobium phaseoli TaxID=396 RepID=UPI002552BD9F|nr:sigma-70 family RNA polymerase sigma factor [Rhizobium phaseoli]MDK4727442.1 sigma-70 family RNA polymerase sigma factor [Rhizobium phaseoli]